MPLCVVLAHWQELLCARPPAHQLFAPLLHDRLDLGLDWLPLRAPGYDLGLPPAHALDDGPHHLDPHHPGAHYLPRDYFDALYSRSYHVVFHRLPGEPLVVRTHIRTPAAGLR